MRSRGKKIDVYVRIKSRGENRLNTGESMINPQESPHFENISLSKLTTKNEIKIRSPKIAKTIPNAILAG